MVAALKFFTQFADLIGSLHRTKNYQLSLSKTQDSESALVGGKHRNPKIPAFVVICLQYI